MKSKIKIVTIVGARPQFIKASALSREISRHPDVHEIIVHTGQHFDANMSDVFFEEMDIPKPGYQLDIHSLGHGAMTGRMLEEIEKVLIIEQPDVVVVYGDTNSTLAGALAAKKLHIKVAHVEAGLRSFNMDMPEEINRILTDRISDLLLCPTTTAVDNLVKEGFDHFDNRVSMVGDVMLDAAIYYKEKAQKDSQILNTLGIAPDDYVLATMHRQENTDDPDRLKHIVDALNDISKTTSVIVPIHPRTRKIFAHHQMDIAFTLIDPVGYLDMVALVSNASIVLTDSGGLQKEAFFFGKYCLTMRDQTEWVELVDGGYNTLVGADKKAILEAYHNNISTGRLFDQPMYGDGHASAKIIDEIKKLTHPF